MAQFQIASITILTPVHVAFTANDVLIVYWDDSTDDFALTLNGASFTTAGALLGNSGTNYTITSGITSYTFTWATASYSFCSGTSLVWFRMLRIYPEYPFFQKVITANSPVCAVAGGAVCDIHFTGAPTIVHAQNSDGGSITVSATSSNGTVKYSMRDFDYATGGQTSGTFSGVLFGTYTIYAKDENDCTASITATVLFKPGDNEHYRFSWTAPQIGGGTARNCRVRIYEREYVGAVVEVNAASTTPFQISKPKQGALNNKFYPIHPTFATLSFMCEYDYQFLPLFTEDNRKYRCVFEVDDGGFTPAWSGFIEPNIYQEPFVAAPYPAQFQICDNVKLLETELFTDDNGNLLNGSLKLIKVIALIMKKTGLTLQIRSGINIFEANHTTAATDDPLDQTYIDVACYRSEGEPFTCWQVLEAILKPFGARILQADNQWLIEETDRATASYAYRVFDSDGVYVSNSTFNPIIDIKAPDQINRAALVYRDHSMEVVPAYGKIDITSKLNYIGSIASGGFEKEDLLSPEPEEFVIDQGVYRSEEGFNGWTLRLNGATGVSFGRVIVSNRGDSSRTGLRDEKDLTRSVGAFYYNPDGWSGNLRDAYIESAVKGYQYGPGDVLKLYFEYSTPATQEYEFMVLRVMVKVGSNYLQPDLSWGASEAIYRAYPPISNSLQEFELTVPVPDTDVVVDSNIQVRIYYYAPGFYDFGLPTATSDPTDGTDGLADLDALVTTGIDYDYRFDIRIESLFGIENYVARSFYELRISDIAEDGNLDIIRAGDFNATTNPVIFYRLKTINVKNREINAGRRGTDLKFYLDNIALDALINGQPPPEEDNISLQISKYITENLEVELYNFDLPDITNGKNMYNNYFRLSDGTPTALWTRSGIAESLTLQEILLKVLGGNHSAPTFRLTGSFINEFARIGPQNFLRLTKPGSELAASNTTFTSNISGWSQSATGGTWAWSADNGGSAVVALTGTDDSKEFYQAITHEGGYVEFTVSLNLVGTSGNTREDSLFALFYRDGSIIHTEKLKTFTAITSASLYEFTHTAFAPGSVDAIGFYIKRVTGTGTCTFQMGEFGPDGIDILEVYQISDYQSDERNHIYSLELMQQSKTYVSLAGIDTGGDNQGGGTGGDFNLDFNGDFDGGAG